MNRKSGLILASILLVLPIITFAAGLVPCGGKDEPLCQGCQFVVLMENVFDWLVLVLSVVFAIILVTAGIRMVTSAGNVVAKSEAKKMIINGFVGFVIVLAAWLLIDFGMKALVTEGDPKFGTWHKIECTIQPVAKIST